MAIPAGTYNASAIEVIVDGEGNAYLRIRTRPASFMVPVTTVEQHEANLKAQEVEPLRSWCMATLYNKYGPDVAERYIEEAEHQDGVEYWLQFVDEDDRYDRNKLIADMETFLEALDET